MARNEPARALLADFDAATVRCPFDRQSRMYPDVPVSILLFREEDADYVSPYLTLAEIQAHPGIRGTGAGTEAMRRVLDLADKHDVSVLLYPFPLDEGWSRERLIRWYNSFGFDFFIEDEEEREAEQDYTMWREPGAKGTRRPNPRRLNPDTSRALSDAQVRIKKALADRNAREWGVEAGWANGAQDLRDAEAFLAWVRTAPATFRVYRALRLRDPSDLHTEGIGTYWAWDRSGADVYQDDTEHGHALGEGEGNVYVVVGEVDTQHVDWGRTFFKNLYDAPWEHEIELHHRAPVRLVAMFPVLDGRDRTDINVLTQPVAARANPYRSRRR